MTGKGGKQEPPLHLDMDFSEALERFVRTNPTEVAESIDRSKQKKSPGARTPGDQATPDGLQLTKRSVSASRR